MQYCSTPQDGEASRWNVQSGNL